MSKPAKTLILTLTAIATGALLASITSFVIFETLFVEKKQIDLTTEATPTPEPKAKISKPSPKQKKSKPTKKARVSNKPRAPLKPLLESFSHEGFEIKNDRITIKKAFKEKLLKNTKKAMALAEGARLFPKMSGGKLRGFTISRIKDNSLLFDAGLRNGDTIEAINGQYITNVVKSASQLMSLRKATKGTVRLRRARKVRTIRIQIK